MRLPIYPGIAYAGTPHAEKVWYILEDASTEGAADDLGLNFAPKLANMAISCPACVQTIHNVWFHLADGVGWVSFAGVRATPTSPDPTGLANGGDPAPTSRACEGAVE